MQKIKTILVRDWDGDPSRVTREPAPSCDQVFANEAVPTRKYDGTAVMVRDGKLYKRYDRKKVKKGKHKGQWKPEPLGWIPLDKDEKTGHWFGWVPVDPANPTDKWHVQAWNQLASPLENGTYELVGENVQGNPENIDGITFVRHGADVLDFQFSPGGNPYDEIRAFLEAIDIEGIVWWKDREPVGKIKKVDFGLPRAPVKSSTRE